MFTEKWKGSQTIGRKHRNIDTNVCYNFLTLLIHTSFCNNFFYSQE